MNDTFQSGEFIFVEKISYLFSEPKHGDIIVFTPPITRTKQMKGLECVIEHIDKLSLDEEACNTTFKYIKRVIGIPGDIIKIEDGVVHRNGYVIDESGYLNETNNGNTLVPYYYRNKYFIVPKNSVFVLGDNRKLSEDSRYWKNFNSEYKNFIPYKKIYGKFLFKMSHIHKIFGPKLEKISDD